MKKCILLALVFILSLSVLAGCRSHESESSTTTKPTTQPSTSSATTAPSTAPSTQSTAPSGSQGDPSGSGGDTGRMPRMPGIPRY